MPSHAALGLPVGGENKDAAVVRAEESPSQHERHRVGSFMYPWIEIKRSKSSGRLPLTEETLRHFERAAVTLDAADCAQLPVWWLREGGKA